MKKSSLIIVALIILFGAIYWFSNKDHISVGVKKIALSTFSLDKVERIEIRTKETIKLIKVDNVWKLDIAHGDKPHLVAADQAHVATMLDAALAIKPSHYVTNIKDKYKDLGLGDGDYTTISIYDGEKPLWVLLLGKNDSGSGRYAKIPDNDDVFVVKGPFWSLTRNGLLDWRNHALWSAHDSDLKSLSIEKDGQPYLSLIKTADKEHWSIDRDKTKISPDFRENKDELIALVRSVINLQAAGFIDEPKELSNPKVLIKVGLSDGEKVLSLFSAGPEKYFAKKSGEDQIYEVAQFAVGKIIKPIEELRDLSLLQFDRSAVSKITIRGAKDRVVLAKKDASWAISEPEKLPEDFEFDQNTVSDLLAMLSGLHAQRLARTGKDVGVNASWQKDWILELTLEKGETVHLFADKDKSSKDEYVVKGNVDSQVYVVSATKIGMLFQGIKAFKKEEFELPPIDENTRGFESLPVDVQRKLLDATKNKKK